MDRKVVHGLDPNLYPRPHNNSKKPAWYVTAVFCALAVAFIATSFQRVSWDFWQPVVLHVGSESVRITEFRQRLVRKLERLSSQNIPLENQKQILLAEIIREKILALELKALGIHVSKRMAQEKLRKRFFNSKGKFEDARLRRYLDHYGLTLPKLVQEEQERIGIERLRKALAAQVPTVTTLAKLAAKGLFQKRAGLYKIFSFSQVPAHFKPSDLKKPDEKTLRAWFAAGDFKAPEYRKYTFIQLSPEKIMASLSLPHQENAREKAMASIQQLFAKIEEEIGMGETIQAIASRYKLPLVTLCTDIKGRTREGIKEEALKFGGTEAGIKDPKKESGELRRYLLQKIFTLGKDQDPDWVQMASGDMVFVVVQDIIPEKKLSYEEALPLLHKKWLAHEQQLWVLAEAQKVLKGGVSSLQEVGSKKVGEKPSSKADSLKIIPLMTLDASESSGSPQVPDVVREALFSLKTGEKRIVHDKKNAYVVILQRVVNPPLVKEIRDMQSVTTQAMQDFLWQTYVDTLSKKYAVSVEHGILQEIFQSVNMGAL